MFDHFPIPQNIQSIVLSALPKICLKALISRKVGLIENENFPKINKYASVLGNYNLIHLFPCASRFFGFKEPIIHGMWSLAWALGELEKTSFASQNPNPIYKPSFLEVKFKRPIAISIEAFFKMEEKLEKNQKDFTIYLSSSKVALDGSLIKQSL